MGGGEDGTSDAELARLIHELERSSLSETDFERRLSMLGLGSSPVVEPQPVPVVMSNVNVLSSSQLLMSGLQNPGKFCSICHVSVEKWVQLPNCMGEHLYCIVCAQRLVSQGVHNWVQKITCTTCGATQQLGHSGIEQFTRSRQEERGRVSYEDGTCPFHKTLLVYYCITCSEPICVACSTGYHKGHSIETLDTAFISKTTQLEDNRRSITSKRARAVTAIERLVNGRNQITEAANQKQRQLMQDIDELQRELDRKRASLASEITALENQKLENVERLLAENSRLLDTCDNALHLLNQASDKSRNSGNPMQFIQFMIDKKEQLNQAMVSVEPVSYQNYNANFPSLPTEALKSKVSSLRYYHQN